MKQYLFACYSMYIWANLKLFFSELFLVSFSSGCSSSKFQLVSRETPSSRSPFTMGRLCVSPCHLWNLPLPLGGWHVFEKTFWLKLSSGYRMCTILQYSVICRPSDLTVGTGRPGPAPGKDSNPGPHVKHGICYHDTYGQIVSLCSFCSSGKFQLFSLETHSSRNLFTWDGYVFPPVTCKKSPPPPTH